MSADNSAEYESALSTLWRNVHAAIERDIYTSNTERRLGDISHLALSKVSNWPANLKSFLWRKHGEGCMTGAKIQTLETEIDQVAGLVTLRPIAEVRPPVKFTRLGE